MPVNKAGGRDEGGDGVGWGYWKRKSQPLGFGPGDRDEKRRFLRCASDREGKDVSMKSKPKAWREIRTLGGSTAHERGRAL